MIKYLGALYGKHVHTNAVHGTILSFHIGQQLVKTVTINKFLFGDLILLNMLNLDKTGKVMYWYNVFIV